MFHKGDRVIVTDDWESNNCKDKIGTIVMLRNDGDLIHIDFDKGQNMNYNNWWVRKRLVKKLDDMTTGGEY